MLENTNSSNPKIKDDWVLKEILHKAVTFNVESLQRDTDELNNAIQRGYKLNDRIKTETGVVYVLLKWKKGTRKVKSKVQLEKQDKSWSILTGDNHDESN